MKQPDREYQEVLARLSGLFFLVLLTSLAILSRGTYGGADDIVHYKFSRYAWTMPSLLLDHWAKPLYTLVASFFAQFGFGGVRVMNALFASASGYLVYRYLQSTGHRWPVWGMLFCLTAPLYFVMAYTGMTEILAGLILLALAILYLKGKPSWSALLLSFLPFVRTETIVFFPVFLLALILDEKWKPLWLLPAGLLVYSLAGWKHYGDFWWVIHRMPYTGAKEIYGHGSLLHFAGQAPVIFGIPLLLFFLLGMAGLLRDSFHSSGRKRRSVLIRFLFLYLFPLVYFSAHSFVWWKGLGGSLGLLRVIVVIVPLMAVGAGEGWKIFLEALRGKKWLGPLSGSLLMLFLAFQVIRAHPHPDPRDAELETVYEACNWMKENGLVEHRVYYYHPFVFYYLGLNPWDGERSREKLPDPEHPGRDIPSGSVVVWDSHFGPNEGRLPLHRIEADSSLVLLRRFAPADDGGGYELRIYQKDGIAASPGKEIGSGQPGPAGFVFTDNFEQADSTAAAFLDSLVVFEGRYSYRLGLADEFGPTLAVTGKELSVSGQALAKISLAYNYPEAADEPAVLVVSVQRGDRIYDYHTAALVPEEPGRWQEGSYPVRFSIRQPGDQLRVYVWNLHKQEILLDQWSIQISRYGKN